MDSKHGSKARAGVILGLFWCHSGVILVSFWCYSGALFWGYSGVIQGLFWCVILVSSWCYSGVILVSFWCHSGAILGLFWSYSGAIQGEGGTRSLLVTNHLQLLPEAPRTALLLSVLSVHTSPVPFQLNDPAQLRVRLTLPTNILLQSCISQLKGLVLLSLLC